MSKIPSFAALPELRFEKFMKFDELGITFHKTPMNIAPELDCSPWRPYPYQATGRAFSP